jgi:hypothetical protein
MLGETTSKDAKQNVCELCECVIEPRTAQTVHIVPIDVTKKAGMPDSATVVLCSNCYAEIGIWYAKNVSTLVYKPKTKRFENKSAVEMVREYQNVYKAFFDYRKRQRKSIKSQL